MEQFAVTSESFELYEAFVNYLKQLGYKVANAGRFGFSKEHHEWASCLFISETFDTISTGPAYAFSNNGRAKEFKLETEFIEAYQFAEAQMSEWKSQNMTFTIKEVVAILAEKFGKPTSHIKIVMP